MLKWEYMFKAIRWSNFDARMDELGNEGWEAYALMNSTESFTYNVYFKRRIPE